MKRTVYSDDDDREFAFVTLFQRGKVWWVRYALDGKQIRQSLKTNSKKQARLLARKIDGDLAEGRHQVVRPTATVEAAIAAYDAALVNDERAPKTLVKYRYILKLARELAQQRNVVDLRGLTLTFIDAYRELRKTDDISPKTLHTELTVIKQLINFALSRDMVAQNPLKGLKLKRPKSTPQPFWTLDQLEKILAAATATRYGRLFEFLAITGLRIGEAVHLAWIDIDLDRNVLHIRAKQIGPKKGDIWRPKTGDARIVPLSPRAVAVLAGQPRKGRWVFPSPTNPESLMNDRESLGDLKDVLEQLGLAGHQHTFRHTFISHALAQNVPEPVVRAWVGHVDAATIRLYTHVADADSKSHMSKLFGPNETQVAPTAAAPKPPTSTENTPGVDPDQPVSNGGQEGQESPKFRDAN